MHAPLPDYYVLYLHNIMCVVFHPPLGMSVIVVSVGVAIASYVLFVTTAI